MLGASFHLTAALVGEPAELVDDSYALVERLTRLHREFAQRIFEVLDPRPNDTLGVGFDASAIAPVVPLRSDLPGWARSRQEP
jgi:hypothetical protein